MLSRSLIKACFLPYPQESVLWTSWYFEVTDETGQVILEFPFREAMETKTQPS